MNKYFKIALCCSFLLCSCKENGAKFFEGDTSIHFELQKNQLDSIVYSFTSTSENYIIAKLPVQIVGYANKTVKFKLKVDPSLTTAEVGKHYEPLAENYTIEAGTYQIDVPVKLLLSNDLNDRSVRLAFTIEPIDGVVAGISYRQKAVVVSTNDVAVIPEDDWEYFYNYIFGVYSKTKHRYILRVLKFNTQMAFEDVEQWIGLSDNQKNAYGIEMNNFFLKNIIMDENGKRIEAWIK